MINPLTGREFVQDFFKNYARAKPCLIRIAREAGYQCDDDETTVLCHITLPGLKAMGKKLIPDLLGAHGCGTCHAIVDGRLTTDLPKQTIDLYHHHGMDRTIALLIRNDLLPNP